MSQPLRNHPEPRPVRATGRSRRVALLAVAMAVMGLADLQLSLTYMQGAGMLELNPVARAMVELGGSRQLVLFKLLTIVMSAGILYLLRRHPIAERCAWASCVALLALTAHWVRYNEHATSAGLWSAGLSQAPTADQRWVVIRD